MIYNLRRTWQINTDSSFTNRSRNNRVLTRPLALLTTDHVESSKPLIDARMALLKWAVTATTIYYFPWYLLFPTSKGVNINVWSTGTMWNRMLLNQMDWHSCLEDWGVTYNDLLLPVNLSFGLKLRQVHSEVNVIIITSTPCWRRKYSPHLERW